jgi:putative endonuclease
MGNARRDLGDAGEEFAARWYIEAGFTVVDRNWRCRDGELDLVVAGEGLVVFCEVKTRRGEQFGAPFEAVTVTKQRRIRGLAARWLSEHSDTRAAQLRFDVASITAPRGASPSIQVITGAF